jgi:dihydroxyacetone kinase
MKKIINKVENVVIDSLEGFAFAEPKTELLPRYKVVKRAIVTPEKVSLISGGGSGHEPSHVGFVGKGMLDAAVCGDVFASPSQIQVYHAIKAVAGKAGVLLIIKNYSGDMMNFQNAAYMAQDDGVNVDFVRVDDDIAVQDSLYTVGRRGVAGTLFVHKMAGAAAEQGRSLPEVKAVAEKVVANTRSLGFAFSSCTVPAKGSPTFELAEDEMEYGVGIHGEPGIQREKTITAPELAARIVDSLNEELNFKDSGSRVTLMVNGFGGSPAMELYVLNKYVTEELLKMNVTIVRTFVGSYMTSIDMAGASISIVKVDSELEALLNEPADTAAWRIDGAVSPLSTMIFQDDVIEQEDIDYEIVTPESYATVGDRLTFDNIVYLVDAMSACVIRNEKEFCDLDSFAGDGDFGMSLAKGFRQLKRMWESIHKQSGRDIGRFLEECSFVIMEYCGGASGPIWGSAFRAAGKRAFGKTDLTIGEFADCLQSAVKGIQVTGERSFGRGAEVGDKTLIDALVPCANVWSEASENADLKDVFRQGATAARDGANATEKIVARMGRAGTVGKRSLGHPDAGAYGLYVIFDELAGLLK